jgi:hypothetical protein
MLLRIDNDRPFPQNDISYVAFVTAAYRNLHQVEMAYDPAQPLSVRNEMDWLLDEIPLLAHLPGSIQIDLLAEVWAKHNAKKVYRASLLEAAVLSAVCRVAADTLSSDRKLVRLYLDGATRDLDLRLDRWTLQHVRSSSSVGGRRLTCGTFIPSPSYKTTRRRWRGPWRWPGFGSTCPWTWRGTWRAW